jgi:hypothetical protein
MQQVVVYRLRAIPKNTAVIGRSQEWSYHSSDIIDANDISLTLKAAFYNGLFNGNAAPQLTPACATGNCTWLPVSSLAFCTKCEDLTSTSPVACNVTRTVAPYDYGYTGGPCRFNIPGSPGLPDFHYQAQSNTAGTHSLKMAVLSTATIGQNGRSFEGIPGPYGGFARVLFSTNSPNVINVTTCVMFPCIKTYNVSVSDGSLVTREHSSWHSENGIDYNDLGPFMFIPPAHKVSNTTTERNFSVAFQAAYGIASLLEAAFNGSSTVDSIDGEAFTSDYMQALYPTGDLGQLMGNVADSLTNYIRHGSSIPYYGTAWDTENYVHVRWVWLILPMALAPVALLFLLSAIWLSSRWNTKVWKSSSLATIFHGFERPIDTINLNWQSEMDELSKQFRVRLRQASDKTHNLMLIGSQVAQFHKESLNPAAASDEFEHIAPPYLTTSNHETRGEDIGRQRIPRRPVGSSIPPGTGQSGSARLENRLSSDVMRGESFGPG